MSSPSGAKAAVPVITIDGPSGSGKGTISRRVAALLDWHLLDSGALYRLVALAGRQASLDLADEAGHAAAAARMAVTFGQTGAGDERVLLAGEDVTAAIGEGADSYIVKPFSSATLMSHLLKVIIDDKSHLDARESWAV
jgi:cytidylate kinase